MHGGAAPQVRRAAARRLVEVEARELVALALRDGDVEVKDPLDTLRRIAGALERAADLVGGKAGAELVTKDAKGRVQLDPVLTPWRELLADLRRTTEAVGRLSVDSRLADATDPTRSPEWAGLVLGLLEALRPHPEALAAVRGYLEGAS